MITCKEKTNNGIKSINKFLIHCISFVWEDLTTGNEYLIIQSTPKQNNEIEYLNEVEILRIQRPENDIQTLDEFEILNVQK